MKLTLTFKPQQFRAFNIIRAQKNPAAFVTKCVLQYIEEKNEELQRVKQEVKNPPILQQASSEEYVKLSDLEDCVQRLLDKYLVENPQRLHSISEKSSYADVLNQQASFFEGAASLFDDD